MKVQKKFLLQGAILLFLGLGLGFGLGSFYASAPVIGCRENDLTPIPDEGFVSPAASEVPAGSVPETPPALNAAGVRATFFVVATGYNEKYLPLLAEAEAAGHQIAFHSASHEYSDIYRSPDAYWQDLALLKERIAPYVYTESIRYLRFPGGSTNTVSKPSADTIYRNVVRETGEQTQCIVLMHDSATTHTTAEALPDIIQWYRDQGFTFCRVEQVLPTP